MASVFQKLALAKAQYMISKPFFKKKCRMIFSYWQVTSFNSSVLKQNLVVHLSTAGLLWGKLSSNKMYEQQ